MISSKIGTKDSWKTSRCDTKAEYIENVIDQLIHVSKTNGYIFNNISKLFAECLSCDEELKNDIGFSINYIDEANIKWYVEHIEKQLNKLDTTALAFLYNAIELASYNTEYRLA